MPARVGATIFMVLVELLHEAFVEGRRAPVGTVTTLTLVGTVVLQRLL